MSQAPISKPTALPIEAEIPSLLQALRDNSRCLLVAQPGAGKTTRVPLALLDAAGIPSGRWLLLEPRRVAARLAAGYMAQQLGENVGQTVGYRVRGESKTSKATRVKVVTQGILTRMLQDDPSLEGIAGVIFDEFHERSLEADLGLALTLDVQQSLREDLRILIMSATLDVGSLLKVLGDQTPVIECPGRTWPIDTYYRSPPAREHAELHQARVISEALAEHEGNILCFLPGQREIRRLQNKLLDSLNKDIDVCPLHGQLTLAQQQDVLRLPATGRRRVILSTAIAESSVTVPGVRIVIDAGLERVPVFQPRSGLSSLETRRVNSASADQRRGRAGREAPGACYRLWSNDQVLAAHREAEILQADLSSLVFELARWGIKDIRIEIAQLCWVSPPPKSAVLSALSLLESLGIMKNDGSLTAIGKRSGQWPTHPRLALLLEASKELDALPLACWLTAWFEESIGGDSTDIHQILENRFKLPGATLSRWKRTAQQWASRAKCSSDIGSLDLLPVLLARAYPDRIAQRQASDSRQGQGGDPRRNDLRFKLVSGGQALVPQNQSLASAEFIVIPELDGDTKGARVFHGATITRRQLEDSFPALKQWQPRIEWNVDAGRLIGEEVKALGAIILERRPMQSLPAEAVRGALIQGLRRRGSFKWSDEDLQLIGRLNLINRVLGEPWPDASDAALMASLSDWLEPRLEKASRLDQVDRLPLARYFLESLEWALQSQLAELAPTHIEVPSGSRIAVDYRGAEPVLAVKLQEMFGQNDTPCVVKGRVPLLIHLLSPARRPVQITRDLAGFWAGSYFEVRKDLKGRYPRHPWPEDPLNAIATARTKHRPPR